MNNQPLPENAAKAVSAVLKYLEKSEKEIVDNREMKKTVQFNKKS